MTSLYFIIQQLVNEAFKAQPALLKHLQRTEYWARTLRPNADEAIYCAALAHDIERSEADSNTNNGYRSRSFRNPEALAYHQNRGAALLKAYLVNKNIAPQTIAQVCNLVAHHEVGGTEEQNFVKDVDSLSFLENNLVYFIDKLLPTHGAEEIIAKFQWMYERISDPQIRELARPYYLEALEKLNSHSKL